MRTLTLYGMLTVAIATLCGRPIETLCGKTMETLCGKTMEILCGKTMETLCGKTIEAFCGKHTAYRRTRVCMYGVLVYVRVFVCTAC
jgi:hypothetical protein